MTPTPDAPVRVVIIEDLREVREGLTVLINGTWISVRELSHDGGCAEGIGASHRRDPGRRQPAPAQERDRRHAGPGRRFSACQSSPRVYDDDNNVFNAICGASATTEEHRPGPPAGNPLRGGRQRRIPEVARRVVMLSGVPPPRASYRNAPGTELPADGRGHHYKTAAQVMHLAQPSRST